jgi:hypothetical protein
MLSCQVGAAHFCVTALRLHLQTPARVMPQVEELDAELSELERQHRAADAAREELNRRQGRFKVGHAALVHCCLVHWCIGGLCFGVFCVSLFLLCPSVLVLLCIGRRGVSLLVCIGLFLCLLCSRALLSLMDFPLSSSACLRAFGRCCVRL